MGFLDKVNQVLSTVKEEKKKAELAKYAKDAPVQELPIIGFVRGYAGLEKVTGVQLCLDGENERVYMRMKAEKGPYEYSCVGNGIPVDNFVELRYTGTEVNKMGNITMFLDYFELVTATSVHIKFNTTISDFSGSDEIPSVNNYEKKVRLNLIYPFINVIMDEETKLWVNEFCQRNDLLPLFNENGEVIVENMRKNAELLSGEE